MRVPRPASLPLVPLLLASLLGACQGEESDGIEASVVSSPTITANTGAPEGMATLDFSVELQARGQPEEVTLDEVRITAQPVTDSSDTLTFSAQMMNTQGDDPVVRLDAGQTLIARVRNAGTTNDQLASWCDTPAELSVRMETADGQGATATSNATVRCS